MERSRVLITMVVRCRLREGKAEAVEEAIRSLVRSVGSDEPGAVTYGFFRSRSNPAEVFLIETYRDEAAAADHNTSEHMGRFRALFTELFDPTAADLMDSIAHFTRA